MARNRSRAPTAPCERASIWAASSSSATWQSRPCARVRNRARRGTGAAGDDEIAFLFIGGGVKMDELSALIARRGLKNFHFLPYQPRDQLADSLGAADVHLVSLLPALEGLIVPSKFYGILAARRPVVFVGDPDGELARIIREANCGRIVAAGDSIDLARVIGTLKTSASACEAMSTAAHELLCSRFSAQRALASWMALLDEVRAARPSAR